MLLLIKFKENCSFRIDCSKWWTDVETIAFCHICIKEIAAKILITCRHFKLQRVYKELNIFICFSVKPSVAVTEKCWEQEQTYVYGSTPLNVNKKDTRYTAVSCNKWARDLKKRGNHLQYLQLRFLISFCVEVLKNKSLSIQMVRERRILNQIHPPFIVFHVSALFSSSFKLISGYISVYVILYWCLIHLLDFLMQDK